MESNVVVSFILCLLQITCCCIQSTILLRFILLLKGMRHVHHSIISRVYARLNEKKLNMNVSAFVYDYNVCRRSMSDVYLR